MSATQASRNLQGKNKLEQSVKCDGKKDGGKMDGMGNGWGKTDRSINHAKTVTRSNS